jgi:hypothetical protein
MHVRTAARQRFFVALVGKFSDVSGHIFVINHLELRSFGLKRGITADFFVVARCVIYPLKTGTRTKKVWPPLCN